MVKKGENSTSNTVVDVVADAQEVLQEVVESTRVLRTHAVSYEGQKKARQEAIASICYAKTSTRLSFSARQLKRELGYDGTKEWLDIQYDDDGKAILIGKSEGQEGVKPIVNDKKLIVYSSLIVKDFVQTLCLDFTEHSSVSAYSFKKEKIAGKVFVVLSQKDFQ